MRSTPLRVLRRSSGFSLLEIIVALAILGISVLTLIQLFSSTLRTVKKTEDYSTALIYARSLMDEAYAKKEVEEIKGYFDLGDEFKGERSAKLVSAEEDVEIYEILVTVWWPPSGTLELKSLRVFHAKEE